MQSYKRTNARGIIVNYKALIIRLTVSITEVFYGKETKLLGCSQSPMFP